MKIPSQKGITQLHNISETSRAISINSSGSIICDIFRSLESHRNKFILYREEFLRPPLLLEWMLICGFFWCLGCFGSDEKNYHSLAAFPTDNDKKNPTKTTAKKKKKNLKQKKKFPPGLVIST